MSTGRSRATAQVADRLGALARRAVLGDPQPGPALCAQLSVELGAVARIRGIEDGRHEAVLVGAADDQPDVGEVGVDMQDAIATAVVRARPSR